MSYIDRELLLIGVDGCISALHVQAKGDLVQEGAIKLVEATRDYIASLSTADVVEVRHAKWKYFHKQNKAVCTNCSFERDLDAEFGRAIVCPNCAARMDKEVET